VITTTKPDTRTLVTVAAAVVGAFSAARALRPAWEVPIPTGANLAEERLQDFRDATYYPIREFLAGGNPYDPAAMFEHWPVRQNFNLYQPYHLVLHLPLVLGTVVIAALLVTSQVGKAQLYVGQVNPLIAVGAAAALMARSRHPRVAALGLAVAWLKPQFGLPLAVLLFARGSRRVALSGTAIAAIASLPVVGLLVCRGGGVGAFLDVIAANLAHASHTSYGAVDSLTAQRVDLPAVFFRTTDWLPPAAELVALVGVLAATAHLARKLDRGDEDSRSVADLITCVGAVVALVHQPGDVLIAVPAMVAVAVVCWRRRSEKPWQLTGAALLALAVPFVHLYFVNEAIVGLFGSRADVTVDGVAIVVAWVLLVVVAARKRA
jgi:hypothetical protein